MDKVPVGQFFSPSIQFSPVSNIPPMFHTHLHLKSMLIRRTNRQRLGIFEQRFALSDVGEPLMEKYFNFVFSAAQGLIK